MAQWAGELGDSHFWFAAQGPFDWPAEEIPDATKTPPQFWQLVAATLKETFAKIDGAGLGLHLASGLAFSLKLGARTGQDAQGFAETLRGTRRLAALGCLAYAGRVGIAARQVPQERLGLVAVLSTMHLAWGSGFLAGCARHGLPLRAVAGAIRRAVTA